ncbi:MAG: HDOD domain-containing protein [Chromatiales bacterium]
MNDTNNEIFIGRQGIYNSQMQLFGYELLYRSSDTSAASFSDADRASSDVLLNTFLEIGIEHIVGPYKAFINLTRKFFVDLPPLPFSQDQVIFELLEDINVDQRLLDGVKTLHEQGYQLAIDDFVFEDKWQPLLPYVSIIKVEVPQLDWDNAADKLALLRQHPVKLLAEKVETEEEYTRLKQLGFDLYQGYFFTRPNIVSAKKIPENQIIILRLLARLNDPEVTIEELDRLIAQDPALSYKILRYINSAAIGLARKVESIRQAVIFMGLNRIKAWASLMVISGIEGRSSDLMTNALVRGYMCQALVGATGSADPDTALTVGILSILDVLMQRPMADILQELPLAEDIIDALLDKKGNLGDALCCTLAYELHEWDQCGFDNLDTAALNEIYLNSSHEAFRAVMGLDD